MSLLSNTTAGPGVPSAENGNVTVLVQRPEENNKTTAAKRNAKKLKKATAGAPEGNGQEARTGKRKPVEKPPRKRSSKVGRKNPAAAPTPRQESAGEQHSTFRSRGKTLDAFTHREVEWFFRPYFPRRMLSLLIGKPNTGKSSVLAWLISLA